MIARKPQKFSFNSSETTALKLPKEDSASFFNQHRNKTAAEAATSILEDLGIKNHLKMKQQNQKLEILVEKLNKKYIRQKNIKIRKIDYLRTLTDQNLKVKTIIQD